MSGFPNEMPPAFDEAAKTNLFHARHAVAHCKLAWKEYSEVLGNARNIAFPHSGKKKESEEGTTTTTVFDSKRCEAAREKLQASIEHVERTYEIELTIELRQLVVSKDHRAKRLRQLTRRTRPGKGDETFAPSPERLALIATT